MPGKTERTITRSERSWVNREYQIFCGRYELDEASGLFFDEVTPASHRSLIAGDFLLMPRRLRDAALYLGLTVSTTNKMRTMSGNNSAVYGDWERPHSLISPHLEMTALSLTSALRFPHLVHECSHLFWAVQAKTPMQAYVGKMLALVERICGGGGDLFDVTAYAQRFFDEWRELPDANDAGMVARRRRAFEKWVVESFCESVAVLCCAAYRDRHGVDTDALLAYRLEAMKVEFGFDPANEMGLCN